LNNSKKTKNASVQRAVSRKRGCMPADSFVGIWKFVAARTFVTPPPAAKPLGRYAKWRLNWLENYGIENG
jgi:hypothetical protein